MRHPFPALLAVAALACGSANEPTGSNLADPCPAPSRDVLVDATHDGGAWWFPQAAPFFADSTHQGKLLADTLRALGYTVTELPRGAEVARDTLLRYRVVIRAGYYGPYYPSERAAYEAFAACPRTLLLLDEYLRENEFDGVANDLGIFTSGLVTGQITSFAPSPITAGVTSIWYSGGSVIDTLHSVDVHILGWLDTGEPVMGVQQSHKAKIFVIGDTNGIETLPDRLLDNLIAWGF